MTKILKSAADGVPDFEVKVAAHASELKSWRAHMSRFGEDEKNGVTGIEKHWPLQRPTAHPLVETAVNESDDAAYEIVDDGPSIEQVLAAKKADLLTLVSAAERAAIEAVVPAGKRRLFNLRESDIRNADAACAGKLMSERSGVINSIISATGLSKPFDVAAAVADARSSEDSRHLVDQDDRRKKIEAIERIAAQAHHDIEDLTIDTVDGWTAPAFPT
jgi:hypothetical protein